MSRLESALREFVGHLAALNTPFAIVGGLAVSARTEPRFTRDADVCVALDTDAEAEALIQQLRARGYEILALVEQEAAGRIATVRMVSGERQAGGVIIDVLIASSGIEREIVEAAEIIDLFEGLPVPIASVPSLVAQKVLARDDAQRPQDRLDIAKMLEIALAEDLVETERLLGLIEARGFARKRDLVEDFRRLREEHRGA